MATTRAERLAQANALLEVIAGCGRQFFRHGDRVARLELDARERVWFVDEYRGDRVFTHYTGRWRHFNSGGTMRRLVERLRDYVMRAQPLPAGLFGPWPSWMCDGDLWGYGEDMQAVREAARPLLPVLTEEQKRQQEEDFRLHMSGGV